MPGIRTDYDKIVKIVETFFENELDGQGNFRFYTNLDEFTDYSKFKSKGLWL